ncbi:uncharacterized protein LOC129606005 [Condylostylus longicornis]|uniref:uncharacterized protein LOC129606005 n=1 Tax=Condylostylus longicornis TaxID=2530218 RepID=UPI00244E2054|nr:uncharacterized protein LOC129606005 [Condylostylus longicornis]
MNKFEKNSTALNEINGVKKVAEIEILINGKLYKVNPNFVPINTSLNTFIRNHANLPGTKFMCLEGGCGACIVTAYGEHPVTKKSKSWAINSCLTLVYACHGLQIITIEGIGNRKDGYNPIQKRLADFHGTQCGYCSPGMVMNMYSLYQANDGKLTMEEIENSFGGNICRCTGYRPILDAFKSFAVDAGDKYTQMCRDMGSDIEDLPTKTCGSTGLACSRKCDYNTSNGCQKSYQGLRLVFDNGKEWHKILSLNDLFSLFKSIGEKTYMLVAGNTAHGVYKRNPNVTVFIDVNSIEELHQCETNAPAKVVLGGNLNLTETIKLLNEISSKKGYEYCKNLAKHIDLIANVPVRNVGTIAGNISIKYAHNEFQSDVYLLLNAVDASIVIAKENNKEGGDRAYTLENTSPENFLKINMNKRVIHSIELKPLDPSTNIFRSYKIMPRAQNAHASVNAAFLVSLNEHQAVNSIRICFGGINSKFDRALSLETELIGLKLYEPETLAKSVQILESSLSPCNSLPDPSPQYRKKLAIGLFYKFLLNICPSNKIKSELKSGGSILTRGLSSGIQTFDTHKDKWPLTQPIQKVEGLVQCSGEAQYFNDIPHQPDELWAAFVQAKVVHSKIEKIDATAAMKLPGVHSFISAKDIPGSNNFSPKNMMMVFEPEEIFCSEKVLYYGQPLGMILADTLDLAKEASLLVKVNYSKTTDPVYPTIKDVFDNKAYERIQETQFKIDPKIETIENRHITLSGRFEVAGQYHFTMEPQTTVCIPIEDGIDVYCATQWIDYVQVAISQSCLLPESSINMHVRRLGGAYGAKITRCTQVACACSLGAILTNRPVRFVLSLESNMETCGKRFGLISDYEVSVDKKGKITRLINNYAQDEGCSINEQPIFASIAFFKNCYNSDSWKVNSKIAVTDSASNTWCRSPGTTEGIAMIENIMEHIARITNLDPIEVRLANIPDDNRIKELLPDFLKSSEYKTRKSNIDKFNSENRWKKRGIGIVPMQYSQDFFGAIPVIVSIYHTDGTVTAIHGGIECGQGINTKIVQVIAKTLNIPLEYIKIKPTVNYMTANSGTTGGSMTSEALCYAAMKACETLLERMRPVREEKPNAKWEEIAHACYEKAIELSATHMFKAADVSGYQTWGVSCAEVEVDILTGNFQLLRVDILEDTGESISPYIDVGQIEGAFVMGLGYWLSESLVYDKNGQLLTNRSWNYKPPGARDIPIDFRINFLRNCPNPLSVLRAKATGEPSLCMSIVALFALRYALDSARKDAGLKNTDWFNLGAPTTIENVLLATGTNSDMFVFG